MQHKILTDVMGGVTYYKLIIFTSRIAEPAILQGLISAIICVFCKLADIDSFIRNPKLTCI